MSGDMLILLLALPAVIAAFIGLRLFPVWPARSQGCDAYYFLLCTEAFRKQRRLLFTLPGLYLLEPDEQWYPPGFAIFLSLFSPAALHRWHWAVSTLVDAINVAALYLFVGWLLGPAWGLLAAFAYAIHPSQIQEFSSLTSRCLALVLTHAFLVCTFLWVNGSLAALLAAGLAGLLIVLTHKLSQQLLWFLVPFLAVADADPLWLVPLAAAYLVGFALLPGVLVKLFRSHWDIVTFWNRNWRDLGRHCVNASPIHGDPQNASGWFPESLGKTLYRHGKLILLLNPWILMLPFFIPRGTGISPLEWFGICWVAGVYIWALLTTFVPYLRCLGEGTKYLKFCDLPTIALTAVLLATLEGPAAWAAWTLATLIAALQIRQYVALCRRVRREAPAMTGHLSKDLNELLSAMRDLKDAKLLVLPLHLADLLAYTLRRPVLWGTHSYGFRMVEDIFPVIRRPIPEIVRRYGLTHAVIDSRFTKPDRVGLGDCPVIKASGSYLLCALASVESPADIEAAAQA